jgi:NAD(P)H-nitrite reductase large subunit
MSALHYVIIGNGTCGNTAAKVLRDNDKDARITIISAEPTHFLYRHNLVNFLISGKKLEFYYAHPHQWYIDNNIKLRLNQPVLSLRINDKTLLLAHRERISFDKLLICSGAKHRVPEYLINFESFLTKFSSSVDAINLKSRLDKIKKLVILGGDCIGLRLIWVLKPKKVEITLIMDDYKFWPLEFDDSIKDRLTSALEQKGIRVLRDDFTVDIKGKNNHFEITTRKSIKLDADEIFLCSGMSPKLDYLVDSGLDLNEGVLVNNRLETSGDSIWAAGECAQIYYPEIKDYRCSTGYANASTQGAIAAKNMLGGSENATLPEKGKVIISGETFETYGWKGFSLDETN